MIRCAAIVAAMFLCASCGNSQMNVVNTGTDCTSSSLTGKWYSSTNNETITFDSTCLFTSTAGCALRGNASSVSGSSGTVTISSVTGAYCTPPSTLTCTYSISGTTLTLGCTPTTPSINEGGTYTKI